MRTSSVQKTYKEADENKQSDWMKKTVVDIKKTVKKHNAILYFEDESNVSLSPVMGTSWSPKREKISLKVTGKRGSVAAVSAISNDGRLLFSLHDSGKRFNSDDITDFLDMRLKLNKISKSQETIFAIFKRCDYAFLYED